MCLLQNEWDLKDSERDAYMRSQSLLLKKQGELLQELMATSAEQVLQISELFKALARPGEKPSVQRSASVCVVHTVYPPRCLHLFGRGLYPLLCIQTGVARAEWFGMFTSDSYFGFERSGALPTEA